MKINYSNKKHFHENKCCFLQFLTLVETKSIWLDDQTYQHCLKLHVSNTRPTGQMWPASNGPDLPAPRDGLVVAVAYQEPHAFISLQRCLSGGSNNAQAATLWSPCPQRCSVVATAAHKDPHARSPLCRDSGGSSSGSAPGPHMSSPPTKQKKAATVYWDPAPT